MIAIAHGAGQSVERRTGIRYRMNASVMFRWRGPNNEPYQGEGVTRDMSVAGAFILTATCPPPNALVQMEVFLPLSDSGSKVLMKSDMTVLRVEHDLPGKSAADFRRWARGFHCEPSRTAHRGWSTT